jgi:hypothetical protein
MKTVSALVKLWGGSKQSEITVNVEHFWQVLTKLLDEGLIPDEPFVIEVRYGEGQK